MAGDRDDGVAGTAISPWNVSVLGENTMNLSNDDRCAVDLILEHPAPGSSTSCLANAPTQELRERLSRVENLLNLIGEFKSTDPAEDLAARTVAYCQSGGTTRHIPREAL